MLTDINALLEYFAELIPSYPLYVTLICAAAHIAAVLICVIMNNKDVSAVREKTSRNTLHTSFWICAILSVPFAGILLYLAFSVIPYLVWRRGSVKKSGFPLGCKLREWQPAVLITAGAAASAAQWLLDLMGIDLTGVRLGAEAAFICWIAVVFIDWRSSLYKKAVFLTLCPAGEKNVPVPAKEILGKKHFTEAFAGFSEGLDKKLIRRAADELIYETGRTGGTVSLGETEADYRLYAPQKEFEKSYADTAEMKYIGRGVTKYIIYEWTENEGDIQCLERIVYRAAPRIFPFIVRTLIFLFMQAALFSPQFSALYRFILNYAADIAGGIIR